MEKCFKRSDQNLNLQKFIFQERYSRQDWQQWISDSFYDFYCNMEHWLNDSYWVVLDKQCQRDLYKTFQGYPLWHLEIIRWDKQPCRDWQVLQAIKNEVVGKEYEAVELYPAHSRLINDRASHLWILAPKEEKETPPRFLIGEEHFGEIAVYPKASKFIVPERVAQAYHAEMSKKQRKHFREECCRRNCTILVFPETLRKKVEREFPGEDPLPAMCYYSAKHPELHLQPFEF